MKKRNSFRMLILMLMLLTTLCSCAEKEEADSEASAKRSDKSEEVFDFLQLGESEEPQKNCAGKWYTEFTYQVEGDGVHEVYLYADIREDGTYDLRWVEPADSEDDTETYKYKLVRSREDIAEKYIHIYFDEKNDQLVMNADDMLVTFNRGQYSEEQYNEDQYNEDQDAEEVVEAEVQEQKDWREIYIAFLSDLLDEPYLTGDFFYVDEDDIPEIIIQYSMGPALYKFYQGEVVEVDKSEADGLGAFFLCEKGSVYAEYFGDETASIYNFYKMNIEGIAEPIVYTSKEMDYDFFTEAWYIDRVPVSKDEYYAKLKEIHDAYGDLRGSFEYSKSVSQLISILEGGDNIPEGPTSIREMVSEPIDAASKEEDNIAAHEAYGLELTRAKNDLYFEGDPNEDYIEYAYADVDNDSIDELIIAVYKSYSAGCATYIYDYNLVTGNTFLIFEGASDITIYSNGVIAEFSSNNHSLGLLWPYSLYRFGEYGEYEYETYVSSWDVEYGDYDNEATFPYEVDADGNGIVYRLYGSYMDDAEFEIWKNNNLGEDYKIQLNYNRL